MLKSHSGVKKRFLKTAGGIKRGRSCRHIMRTRKQSRKRILRKHTLLIKPQMKLLKKFFQSA